MIELALVRNKIARQKFGDREKAILLETKNEFETSKNVFREIILNAIENCIRDAESGDFESASAEVNLIHNLPDVNSGTDKWNEEYFYDVELPTYLKSIHHQERAQKIKTLLVDIKKN